jgi:sugar/nucleoside kinase (ribokinase family)
VERAPARCRLIDAAPTVSSTVPAPACRVIVVGDVFDDLIVTPSGEVRADTDTTARIERRDGGSAANAAAWFAERGHETYFFGRVGRVDAARHTESLERAGVTAHLGGDDDLPTGTIVVVLQPDRTRTMLTERGANARTMPDDIDRALLTPGAHLHLTAYTLFPAPAGDGTAAASPSPDAPDEGAPADDAHQRLTSFLGIIGAARAAGATVSVNPGSAGFIADHGAAALLEATAGVTIAVPNLDEGRLLTGARDPADVVTALLEHYEVVALTLGRDGAIAAARSGAHARTTAIPVDPVDTTGAGDAFGAAFVSALLAEAAVPAPPPTLDEHPFDHAAVTDAHLARALEEGAAAAARAIAHLGGRPPVRPRVPNPAAPADAPPSGTCADSPSTRPAARHPETPSAAVPAPERNTSTPTGSAA